MLCLQLLMTLDDYDKVCQCAEHLKQLKRFEAFLSSHINLQLAGDKRGSGECEYATVPAIVQAEWLAGARTLVDIATKRFAQIEINNIND